MKEPRMLIIVPITAAFGNAYHGLPEGLVRLKGYLRNKKIRTDVVTCPFTAQPQAYATWQILQEKGTRQTGAELDLGQYDLIALSLVTEEMAADAKTMRYMLRELRKKAPNTPFIAGGVGVWRFPFNVAGTYADIDFVVYRWGEVPLEFIAREAGAQGIRHPLTEKGIERMFGTKIFDEETAKGTRTKYVLAGKKKDIPGGIYARYAKGGETRIYVTGEWEEIPKEALEAVPEEQRVMEVTTQFGCAYGRCTFCEWAKQNKHVRVDPKLVLKKIEAAKPRIILINDACFLFKGPKVKESKEILEGIKRLKEEGRLPRGTEVEYECRADAFDVGYLERTRLIRLMKDAGTVAVNIGFESGSDRVLKEFKKGTTVEQNVNAIDVRENNFPGAGYFILTSPKTELPDVIRTLELLAYAVKRNGTNPVGIAPGIWRGNKKAFCIDAEHEKPFKYEWPHDPLSILAAVDANRRMHLIEPAIGKFVCTCIKETSSMLEGYLQYLGESTNKNCRQFCDGLKKRDCFKTPANEEGETGSFEGQHARVWREYIDKGKYHAQFAKAGNVQLTYVEAARMENEKLKRMLETDDLEELRGIMLGKLDAEFAQRVNEPGP